MDGAPRRADSAAVLRPSARGARAAVVAAVVLLTASAGGAAVRLVGDDDGPTTEVLAPVASRSPTTSPTPSPTPAATTPRTPTPAPTTTAPPPSPATTSPSPTPSEQERDVLDADDRLTTTGIGPLQVGMSYDEVERASGREVRVSDWLQTDGACVDVALVGIPEQEAVFMYGSDGVVRGFVLDDKSTRATRSGVRIGDTEQRVREVYGDRLQEQEHPIGGTGKTWLYVEPEGSGHQLVLWLQDGRVVTMSSGYRGWAMMYEGCA